MKIAHVAAFHKKGNAGDILLPYAVKKIVQKCSSEKIEWLDIQARDIPDINTIKLINECSMLVIGGGGLFLPDTNYNEISGWQWPISTDLIDQIEVPIYLRGVGFNLFRNQKTFNKYFDASILTLANKCIYMGLRNSGSIQAIRKYLPYELHHKVILDPCPTTLSRSFYSKPAKNTHENKIKIGINLAFDREELRYGDRVEALCADIAEALMRSEAANNQKYIIEYFSHFNMDDKGFEILKTYIPEIIYISLAKMSAREIVNVYDQSNLTIGTRGHSQLISFGCLTPFISIITHDKLQWFLDDINRPEWGYDIYDFGWGAEELEKAITNSIINKDQTVDEIKEVQKRISKLLIKNSKIMFS